MEKKATVLVTVLLQGDREEIELRDRTTFTPTEVEKLHAIFGKDWLNEHPVVLSDSKLTLDLSAYEIDSEDLQYFAHVYNDPLALQETLQKEATNFAHVQKFLKISRALKLNGTEATLNNIRDQLFAKKKILILMDLNGSLMCKSEKNLGEERPYDLKWKWNHIYLRPGYNIFLKKILEHPRSEVAICSSMVQTNIQPIRGLFVRDPEVKKVEGKFLKKIFDRSYTLKDPMGKDEHATLRDLKKVWKDSELKGKYGPQNTLLIESDEAKARNHKANLFVLFPYVECFVTQSIPNNTYYMSKVADYIVDLLNKADDVPEYLMKTPFEFDELLFQQEDTEFKKILEEQKARLAKEAAKKAEEQKFFEEQKSASARAHDPPKLLPKDDQDMKENKTEADKMKDIEENIKKMENIDI